MKSRNSITNNAQTLVKNEVSSLPKYIPGLPEEVVRQRHRLDHIARLASNENPFGTGEPAIKATAAALSNLWRYSDPDSTALRQALSERTGVDLENIVVGNGSEDLICLLCRACVRHGERVITVHPAFPLHEIYPLEQGAEVVSVPMTTGFKFDIQAIVSELKKGCKLLFISNPSNPVGTILNADDLDQISRAATASTLIIIDEAYYEYVAGSKDFGDSLMILRNNGNPHVVLRTFSKAYGLAGIRVGYGLFSDGWLAQQINKLRTPFNVNLLAQAAATAALGDYAHLAATISHNQKERVRVNDILRGRGYTVAPSWANFLFVDCRKDSREIAKKLETGGVIVKPWTAPGYECFIRVTIGKREDNDRFLQLFTSR